MYSISFLPLANFHCTLPLLANLHPHCFSHFSVSPFFSSLYILLFSFPTLFPLTSFHLSLSQGLSLCHMTNGTTILRPGYVMQWLSSPQRLPPWCWTGGHTPCWSQAVSGHLTKRSPILAIPRKYWGELKLWR